MESAALAPAAGRSGEPFAKMAAMVKRSFGKFWNSGSGCCFDVIDAPGVGNDATLRPNQIFAVSLPESPLTPEQQRAVVDVCARRLVTVSRAAQPGPGRAGLSRALRRCPSRAGRSLSPRDGVGLADGTVCIGAPASLRRS